MIRLIFSHKNVRGGKIRVLWSIPDPDPSQNLSPLKYMGQPLLQSMFLSVVTPDEVHKIINSLKNGAAGYDELSASILKMISPSITSPLAYLCNLSFDQGVFPRELTLANVIPLYKADDPCSFNNYRPVSLLCAIKGFRKGYV